MPQLIRTRRVRALAAALALVAPACQSGNGAADPEIATVETDADLVEATAAVFADLDATSPGCAVAVRHSDGSHVDQFGSADLDAGEPIRQQTTFDIGSVSKQITAGAAGLLVVRGELSVDDDITSILTDLGPYDDVITVGDLIHHTSGLPDYTELLDADIDDVTTNDDVIAFAASDDGVPSVGPGEVFEYSNTNYVLLSLIVAEVSGRTFPEFVATEVFQPLRMTSSRVRDDQGSLDAGQAVGYELDGDDWFAVGSAWQQTGDGAVHTTAADLVPWMELFLNGRSDGDLGSPAWLEFMRTPGAVSDEGGNYGGGLSLTVTEDGDELLSHSGSWIGYGSALAIEPSNGVGVAVTCNVDDFDAESRADQVLEIWADAAG